MDSFDRQGQHMDKYENVLVKHSFSNSLAVNVNDNLYIRCWDHEVNAHEKKKFYYTMSLRQNIYGDSFKKLETSYDENYWETWTSEVRLANTAYTRRNALPTHQDN